MAGEERGGRPPHRLRYGGCGRGRRGHPREGRPRSVRRAQDGFDGVPDHVPAPQGLPRRPHRTGHEQPGALTRHIPGPVEWAVPGRGRVGAVPRPRRLSVTIPRGTARRRAVLCGVATRVGVSPCSMGHPLLERS
ncbi:protein of unknown function [Streptomyces sp. KY75]|nr:protein of unknown function [Streptomyces sp. KY70]CAD5986697.1 protein of unknown function [Streptomyces sp. KY75]